MLQDRETTTSFTAVARRIAYDLARDRTQRLTPVLERDAQGVPTSRIAIATSALRAVCT